MRSIHIYRVIAAMAILFCAGIAQAGKNPVYESWASHAVGSSVQSKKTMGDAARSMQMDITYTLSEVTPDQVTVEVKSVMNAAGRTIEMPSRPLIIPAQMETKPGPGGKPSDGADAKIGEETLTVDGKPYKCFVVEVTKEERGSKIHGKAWQCKDVPNMLVKMEAAMEGAHSGQYNEEVVKIDLK